MIKVLENYISDLNDSLIVAFSGGVDSSLVLKATSQVVDEDKLLAITIQNGFTEDREIDLAKDLAEKLKVRHEIINIDLLESKDLSQNPKDRCYICKTLMFEEIIKYGKDMGYSYVLDGSNFDDTFEYRPGLKALEELGVLSPLKDLKIDKKTVRLMAKEYGLHVYDKPSTPCLLTRMPYDTEIDKGLLEKIEKGEAYLKDLGYESLRMRVHDNIVRIEVPEDRLKDTIEDRNKISRLKELGFDYICLDIEGLRSGSMDIGENGD